VKTEFKDIDCLVKSLVDKGWTESQIQVGTKLAFKAYYARQNTEVDVLIKKKNLKAGSYGDLGFKKEDGKYTVVIDRDNMSRGHYNEKWFNDLKQRYTYHKIKKEAKRKGYKVYEKYIETDNGKVLQLKLKKVSYGS